MILLLQIDNVGHSIRFYGFCGLELRNFVINYPYRPPLVLTAKVK